jgi:Tfp pilus assembly protein PilO
MSPEDIKRLLIIVSTFLLVFLAFFFLFWRPMFSDLRDYQNELADKKAELARLEKDARDWPRSITRDRLDRYEMELTRLLAARPQRTQAEEGQEPKYVKVPYEISVGGNYSGLIRFLRKLEDSRRLVTVDSIKLIVGQGSHLMDANIQFNIFYSKVGVEAS